MIQAKSLADPVSRQDGTRILITRFRPRGIRKGKETWSEWEKRLAPSIELFDAFYGRKRVKGRVVARDLEPIPFAEYARRFTGEMRGEEARGALADLRRRSRGGEVVTVLCFCKEEGHCHRSLVKKLLSKR